MPDNQHKIEMEHEPNTEDGGNTGMNDDVTVPEDDNNIQQEEEYCTLKSR